jgi:branched-chain amino acid transport system permease protein
MTTMPRLITPERQQRSDPAAGWVGIAGGVVLAASAFLPWAYAFQALDGMSLFGYPSSLQILGMVLGLLVAGLIICSRRIRPRGKIRVGWVRGAKAAGTGALVFLILVTVAISLELGGLVNVVWGGWIALLGAVITFIGTRLMVADPTPTLERATLPAWLEILAIAVVMAAVLFAAAYVLNLDDGGAFVAFLAFLITVIAVMLRTGAMGWLSAASRRHRQVLILSAFVVAFLFPFTQGGSDANMSIATQILIFAATAMGLNIVVGLAGLLDLGYIAFLGAGAFTAAVLSKSAFSTVNFHPPFLVTALISGLVAATLGLIIGSPTLRVSGDYLAIVTLGFGEIFRLTMGNLDGENGPNITRGPNGIPAIPNLEAGGFDFGKPHTILGFDLGRFANYYFLLLIFLAFVILVFTRLNNSRIGRGWVAIREDEKAAEAMGVNTFGLKLFAFASGAFLAGLAGSIKAHVDVSITPDQFIFLESAFLLAAIVLGGMGTVLGVLVGATLLKLLPEKLRFISEYRLLAFGLLLILMMRFRPEGLIPSQRRQLEFHEENEELAERIEEEVEDTGALKGAAL